MKFTFFGFSQAILIEKNIQFVDAAILRWIIDFQSTGGMKKIEKNKQTFVWINYKYISDEIPLIHVGKKTNSERTKKNRITESINRLVDAQILKKWVKKDKEGTYIYVSIMEKNYKDLVSYNPSKHQQNKGTENTVGGVHEKRTRGTWETERGYMRNVPKDYSINNKSIKDNKHTVCDFKNGEYDSLKKHPELKNINQRHFKLSYIFHKKLNEQSPLNLKLNKLIKTTSNISKIINSSTLSYSEIKDFCLDNLNQDFKKNIHQVEFNKFWDMYGKKKKRKDCLDKWKRVPKKDKLIIFETLPKYIKSVDDKHYLSHPLTYLNGKCWDDEIDEPTSKTKAPKSNHSYIRTPETRPEEHRVKMKHSKFDPHEFDGEED